MVMPSGMSMDFAITVVDADLASGRRTLAALRASGFANVQLLESTERWGAERPAQAAKTAPEVIVLSGKDRGRLLQELREQDGASECCVFVACANEAEEADSLGLEADEVFSMAAAAQVVQMRFRVGYKRALERHGFAELERSQNTLLEMRRLMRQRSLETQIQHSSQFLANLIDSAVDAIMAADMRGRVIVFNRGAEQLFGYKSDEVVGKMPVWKLYPDEVPGQVMRMLRSSSYGGVGRLEQVRREVRVRSGENVPVNMTSAMIYEDGQEVASVGIFSDLRDRIRIEQRLLQTQEQLQEQEQRSMLAELAGAAAHELNQPLTSIIGYAQLIQRTSELGARHLRYTDTIIEEADRMAEIVKKIGRITHYETVPYVGTTNIVDLDRSVEASQAESVPAVIIEEEEATARISLERIAETHEEEMRSPSDRAAQALVQQSRRDKNESR